MFFRGTTMVITQDNHGFCVLLGYTACFLGRLVFMDSVFLSPHTRAKCGAYNTGISHEV